MLRLLTLLAVPLLVAACGDEPTTSKYTGYFTGEIPPCTPAEGSSVDPCEPDRPRSLAQTEIGEWAITYEDMLEQLETWPHNLLDYVDPYTTLVLRATLLPDTVRCATNEGLYHRYGDTGSTVLSCYVDIRVNDYIVGVGPPVLAVELTWFPYSPDLRGMGLYGITPEELRIYAEWSLSGEHWLGTEEILILTPTRAGQVEAWDIDWNVHVQRRADDGKVVAVNFWKHFWRDRDDYYRYRDQLEISIAAFKQAMAEATQQYDPTLLADANRLPQYSTNHNPIDPPVGPPPLS